MFDVGRAERPPEGVFGEARSCVGSRPFMDFSLHRTRHALQMTSLEGDEVTDAFC